MYGDTMSRDCEICSMQINELVVRKSTWCERMLYANAVTNLLSICLIFITE